MQPQRSLIALTLISPDENRLRSGWRLLAHLLIFAAVLITLTIAWLALTALAGKPSKFGFTENQILTAVAITFSIALARRLLDRRAFVSLGLQLDRRTPKDLLAGFMIAALMMLLIYTLERLAGWLSVTAMAWQDGFSSSEWLGLGTVLVVFVVVGWQEELYFRGYLMQNLRDGLNLVWAFGLSSAVFGLAHIQNPNWSWMGLAGITLAGLFMAFGWHRTGRLWLPIGLHIGWNFFEGPVLGFPVSGMSIFQLIQTRVSGPELYTGGNFGPEAGLVLLPALAMGTLMVWLYTRSLGHSGNSNQP